MHNFTVYCNKQLFLFFNLPFQLSKAHTWMYIKKLTRKLTIHYNQEKYPFDYGCFFKHLKKGGTNRSTYYFTGIQSSVFKNIELYYNTKYAHSALGYLSPAQSKKENS